MENSVSNAMLLLLEATEKPLRDKGLTVIRGKMAFSNVSLIHDIESLDFLSLLTEGSFAVTQVGLGDDGKLVWFNVNVRIGTSSTWIRIGGIEPPEEEDDDDNGWRGDPEITEQARHEMIVALAKDKGFRQLRNQQQRSDYADAKFLTDELTSLGEIAYQAYMALEFGLLPIEAQTLQKSGMDTSGIAKEMGITKAKAAKLLDIVVDETYGSLFS